MKSIAAKLSQLSKKCDYLQRDAKNNEQKYTYVSSAAVLRDVNAGMVELGLCSVVTYQLIGQEEILTSNGKRMRLTTVSCSLTIIDSESGESVIAGGLGSGTDNLDKAIAKAQTMALKYAWMSTLAMSTGDDPEEDTGLQPFPTQQPYSASPMNPQDPLQQLRQTLRDFWMASRFDPHDWPGYAERRYGGKPFDQLSAGELEALLYELNGYYQRKGEDTYGQ